jgi:glycosidase
MVWDELLYDNEVISAASRFQTGQGTYKVKVDKSLWNFYRRLGAMRQACESLRFGSTEFLQLEGKRLLGFMRRYGNETVVAFFNLGDKSEIVQYPVAAQEIIDLSIGDAIKVENSQLRFPLWANSFAAYRIKH